MIPLVNYRHRYVYYFNAKSACSTYRRFFMELHAHEKDYGGQMVHHLATRFWKPDPAVPFNDFFALTIVRNPFNRLVSGYLDKCFQWKYVDAQRYTNESGSKFIHPPIFSHLGRKPDYNRGFSFREFVSYLEVAIPKKTADIHFLPQAREDIRIDAFYRLEDPIKKLEETYRSIFRGKPKMLERFGRVFEKQIAASSRLLNPSFRKEDAGVFGGSCCDLTFADFEELKKQNLRPQYPHFFDEELARRVAQLYALEIAQYGYRPPNIQRQPPNGEKRHHSSGRPKDRFFRAAGVSR